MRGGLQHPLAAAHDRQEGHLFLAVSFVVPAAGQLVGPILAGVCHGSGACERNGHALGATSASQL